MKTKRDGIYTKANNLVDDLNDEVTASVLKGITSKRLMMMRLKGRNIPFLRVFETKTNNLVWTRGDGSRYKEPSYLRVVYENHKNGAKNYATFKRLFPTTDSLLDYAWADLKSRPRVTYLGKISGEFGSSESCDAIRVNSMIWIKRDWGIEYASPSLLRNDSVWQLEEPTDEVS